MKLLQFQKKAVSAEPLVLDQQDDVQHRAMVDTNASKPIRLGMFVLLVGFGGFLLWACLAPLDAGVPAPGVVSVDSQRKSVQHFHGGIVQEILVREGDHVKAGQPLITLDQTDARAQLEVTRIQYLSALATENRLMAEYANQPRIHFHEDLLSQRSNSRVADIMAVQTQLFTTRRASHAREAAVLNENAAAMETQLVGLRDLAKDGYVPRNKMLDSERSFADIRLRMLEAERDYREKLETMLGDAQRDASALHDKVVAAQEELDRTEIKAPVDGMVMSLAFHTVGGVVAPGGRILDIVPDGDPLVVEANIPVQLIDQVHPGQEADLRFTSFNQNRTPVIAGRVVTVSADRLTDQNTHQPFYLARISVAPEELKKLGTNQIQAGMPAEVIVKNGSRTVMNYLLKPLFDRFASSLKER